MNDIKEYFYNNTKRKIDKWNHYFDIYEEYFSQFRNTPVRILEIGVSHGGSLQMWKHYFGDKAEIFGIDINPICKTFEEDRIKIFIGSQSDTNFMSEVAKELVHVDILIDDGGHTMIQQITAFDVMYSIVDHIYLVEDTHTSYWREFGGGVKRKGTFIEYAKSKIDELNSVHYKPAYFPCESIHFFDSIVIFKKGNNINTGRVTSGVPSFHETQQRDTILKKIKRHLRRLI